MTKHGKAEKATARTARLAAALRENLKRRKAQAKERYPSRGGGPDAHTPGKKPEAEA
jgi:hypothetical protein